MVKNPKAKVDTKRRFSDRRLALIAVMFTVIIVISVVTVRTLVPVELPPFSWQAAIIDQIGTDFPSTFNQAEYFNTTVTGLLLDAGFNVSYYRSEDVNVSLYQRLIKLNLGMIILRAHSAVRQGDASTVDFFTSERYDSSLYKSMLENGLLTLGEYQWQPNHYFAVTPQFIENLEGAFPRTIFMATGCTSLNPNRTRMAQAFISKGAQAYIGWTDSVSLLHSDNSTMLFLREFLSNNRTIAESIGECNKIPDPEYWAKLDSYPSEIADKKLPGFTAQASLLIPLISINALRRRYWGFWTNVSFRLTMPGLG